MSIKKLTKNAISLLKNLIETQSFSTEEENTALLIEAWFTENEIPLKEQKITFGQPINILMNGNQHYC
jgi:acetylornithine deacetylase